MPADEIDNPRASSEYSVTIESQPSGNRGFRALASWIDLLLSGSLTAGNAVVVDVVVSRGAIEMLRIPQGFEDAARLRSRIELDLDSLDPVRFAAEWGL